MRLATRITSQNRLIFRHKLPRVFRESRVITEIWADALGNIGNTTTSWEAYWGIGEGGDLPSSVRASLQVLRGGRRTFSQLSLTDYFRGIWALKQASPLASPPPNAVFYSARQFNPSSAISADNQSIFSVLAHRARLVVTEDVDLGPEQLRNHLEKFNLMDLAASDATDHVRMQSAHLLCITARQHAASLPGKRLW